ncbi:hypothetical protein [Massilia endophytica]|uniref:hypothetical protein n=1 Tax=Massilia endophytica TaxID=2899220 RepID=UPI001E60A901|nr:hypothetical protein [Massilia endophytica]UGQ46782.1 hypothetical protein LSQ66_23975 [Massilia endophytica]
MDEEEMAWRSSIERRLAAVEKDVAVIMSNYATKEDLARLEAKLLGKLAQSDARLDALEARLIKWFVATAAAMSIVTFSAALTVARMMS